MTAGSGGPDGAGSREHDRSRDRVRHRHASILAVAGVGFTLQFGVTNIHQPRYGGHHDGRRVRRLPLVTSAGLSVWLALVVGAAFGSVFSVLLNRCIYTPRSSGAGRGCSA